MSAFDPTSEQVAARDLFSTGHPLVIEAGAGTGKSSTLDLLGRSTTRRGQYCAFNKALVSDAQGMFPENVAVNTIHSLAFRAVGRTYAARLNEARRLRNEDVARFLRLEGFDIGEGAVRRRMAPGWLAGQVLSAVRRFCQSADETPSGSHVAYVEGLDMPTTDGRRTYTNNDTLRRFLAPFILRAWLDLCQTRGSLRFEHAHYLKLWQLGNPVIPVEFVLLDEAQDVSPVMEAIIFAQEQAQLVAVGDRAQELYAWAGAQDSMPRLAAREGAQTAYLSQSFRFGQPIADVANILLTHLGTPLRLRGLASITSTVQYDEPLEMPHAVLCRTNATAVRRVLVEQGKGRRAALVGDGKDVLSFAEGAQQLQQQGHTSHRELSCFPSWGMVQAFVANDPNGDELRLLVRLVDEFGTETIQKALGRLPREADAEIVVSTAHKAKGRAWPTVSLADDFPAELTDDAEIKLLYVAATRARQTLDVSACPALTEAKKVGQ